MDVSILHILVTVQGQLHSIFRRKSLQKSGKWEALWKGIGNKALNEQQSKEKIRQYTLLIFFFYPKL